MSKKVLATIVRKKKQKKQIKIERKIEGEDQIKKFVNIWLKNLLCHKNFLDFCSLKKSATVNWVI